MTTSGVDQAKKNRSEETLRFFFALASGQATCFPLSSPPVRLATSGAAKVTAFFWQKPGQFNASAQLLNQAQLGFRKGKPVVFQVFKSSLT
ncbi:MAG: hypothetical protein H6559_33785 [Lewinellaceae bacterium]|nr:hypothetical protein [Lewinellaceae bacterium]